MHHPGVLITLNKDSRERLCSHYKRGSVSALKCEINVHF